MSPLDAILEKLSQGRPAGAGGGAGGDSGGTCGGGFEMLSGEKIGRSIELFMGLPITSAPGTLTVMLGDVPVGTGIAVPVILGVVIFTVGGGLVVSFLDTPDAWNLNVKIATIAPRRIAGGTRPLHSEH